MTSFSKFYEQEVISSVEPIFIEGVGQLSCKVDTGNESHNVLHAVNISKIGDHKIRFLSNNKTLVKKHLGTINIHTGSGHEEERYIVPFNLKFKSKFYENVPFTLADRSWDTDFPVLMGEPFLKKIYAVVDVNKPQLLSSHST